jgi:hypothetical protein
VRQVLKERNKEWLEAARVEVRTELLRHTTLDGQRNANISASLNVQSTAKEIQSNQKNWIDHVERMHDGQATKTGI